MHEKRPTDTQKDQTKAGSTQATLGSDKRRASRNAVRVRRVAIAALATALALAVLAVGTVGWVGSERAIHPKQHTYSWRLSDYPNLRAEEIVFHSGTGLRLDGWFFRGASRATIILSHGYGDDKDQMLPWADFLNRAGYNVIAYDMRSRGHSGGTAATLGALEQIDLMSVVDYLTSRPDVDPTHIGALGVSLGGSVTILAAARDRRIRAVVDDCGFSDAPSIISATFEHFVGLPAFPFAPVTVKIAEIRTGVDINGVRPVDRIGLISPRAIFIIHGLADRTVPPADSARNYAAARPPKTIWFVPGAHHVESLTVARAAYVSRVVGFFRRYLGN